MAKHFMMLSDLYGRIGQMLKEHGDAPIGRISVPVFIDEIHIPMDYVSPMYCTFTHVVTDINNVKICTYEPIIDE